MASPRELLRRHPPRRHDACPHCKRPGHAAIEDVLDRGEHLELGTRCEQCGADWMDVYKYRDTYKWVSNGQEGERPESFEPTVLPWQSCALCGSDMIHGNLIDATSGDNAVYEFVCQECGGQYYVDYAWQERREIMTEAQILAEMVLEGRNGPEFKTLKKNKVDLTPEERKEVMARKATWHFGKNGGPSPAVWKAEVDGKNWYVTNTHRAYNVRPTLKGAISRYHKFIKSTA